MRTRRERVAAVVAATLLAAGAAPARAAVPAASPRVGAAPPAQSSARPRAASPGAAAGPGIAGQPAAPAGAPPPSNAPPPNGALAPGAAGAPPLGPDPNAQATSLSGPGPLVANGLGSPSCRDPAQLSPTARADCSASGIAVAPAPLENYQFDVHIDTGLLATSAETLIQDVLLKPAWMALVWLTHVAVVALEWCFSLDLLGSGTLGPVARGLRAMRGALTTPWLAPVLAIAAIALVYNGIVRRRVVDTLGQLALLLAMMIGGLWVIADPGGSVGAASRLANEASLGALGAAATGDPSHPLRSLDDALGTLFDASVTGPWCYLEFGNVDWCRQPSRLDPGLVSAAGAVVAADRAAASSSTERRAVAAEAAEIGRARTNGELFLALPANGPRRNSINADASNPSLLRVLCGSDSATSCSAATGPQAEFRTGKGTAARLGGLLLIAIGDAGMFALIGFICLRLLGAALLALVYLLIAPVAVLAPALGEGGRTAFRHWSLRLLGAVVAKLVYSVFLGVVLLIVQILSDLGALGWWTQWLLIAVFWWLVFNHRHRVLETVIHERGESTRQASLANRLFATRQAIKLGAPPARMLANVKRRTSERLRHLSDRTREIPSRGAAVLHGAARAGQVARTLERDHAQAVATLARAPALELELGELRAQRARLRGARHQAVAGGDRRRAVSLQRRERDIDGRIESGERELAEARDAVAAGEERRRRTGLVHDESQRTRRAELLDRAAEVRPRLARPEDPRRGSRNYAELAGLADLAPRDYLSLSGAERRRVQLAIDLELENRRGWKPAPDRPTPRDPVDRLRRRPPQYGKADPRPARRTLSPRERQFTRRPAHGDAPRPQHGDAEPRLRREFPPADDDRQARQLDRRGR